MKPTKPKVVLLTTFVAPYRISLFEELQKKVGGLKIFISTKMEPNRKWDVEWRSLDVTLQKTISIPCTWKHPHGFQERYYLHIPIDTIFLLQKNKPDVVISVEFGFRTIFSIIYSLFHPNCKLIIWATISSITEIGRSKVRTSMRKFLLKFCDAVLVNGKSGREYINSLGFSNELIFYAPYSTDTKLFKDINISRHGQNAHRLLFIGQLIERKGLTSFVNELISWLKKNKKINFEFWIAGYGQQLNYFKAIELPLNLKINYLGAINYYDLPNVYQQCGALIFPTMADEWGIVVNEAMASGCIVIGSIFSQSVMEMVFNDKNGWTFNPNNLNEIENILDNFYETEIKQLNEMRKIAKNTSEVFSSQNIANLMNSAIQYVLNEGKD
jgi:glycosyltransferase involved in cell wall biosynthesis